jgi:rhomboid protease GluP
VIKNIDGIRTKSNWVITSILSVNIIYFIISLLLSRKIDVPSGFLSAGDNSLFMLGATGTIPIDRYGRYWTLLTSNYLHSGIFHILFNLLALRQIAPSVSEEYGKSRMFSIYTLGGVFGYGISYLAGIPYTIGASASVCSLIGSMLYFGKSRGGRYGNVVYRETGGWVISIFLFGLIIPGINNWGHGGGLLGGILFGILLGYNEKREEGIIDHALAFLCASMTITALAWALFGARI